MHSTTRSRVLHASTPLLLLLFLSHPQPTLAQSPTVIDRQIRLERGEWLTWVIDYRLSHTGEAPLLLKPDDLYAEVSGLVSNSRVDGHAVPRSVHSVARGAEGCRGHAEVIPSTDDSRRCSERITLQVWPDADGPEPPQPVARIPQQAVPTAEIPEISWSPDQALRVRLRLEHQHPLYGPFDPLLGVRPLTLRLGPLELRQSLPLDNPPPLPIASPIWPPRPPVEFLDTRIFLSAPDSLHLDARVPGQQSYRFPDLRGVHYGLPMRLSFWYLIAPDGEGTCQARISQYRDLPSSWKTLSDGEVLIPLETVGHWTRLERTFTLEPQATSLTLDLRISGGNIRRGELWIDDLQLEPATTELAADP